MPGPVRDTPGASWNPTVPRVVRDASAVSPAFIDTLRGLCYDLTAFQRVCLCLGRSDLGVRIRADPRCMTWGMHMATVAVVGAQWGDEGKGKVTDVLAERAHVVARYSGGRNAGHTLTVGDRTYRLHLVPSGVLYPGTTCLIGNGVVVDPPALVDELDGLASEGLDVSNVFISDRAHVVMPYHRLQDRLEEEGRGENKIGTTGLGIGPAYSDKVGRYGIRMADLIDEAAFRERLEAVLPHKNRLLANVYGHPGYTVEQLLEEYRPFVKRLRPTVTDVSVQVTNAIESGRSVLFEGAQGTLLDIDHGTYPFVTSSSPTTGGICTGLGIGPSGVHQVIGVTKAYTTRVGEGPFPTELQDETCHRIRERGREYGTTTGRPRRCGWFDAVIVRHARRVNGITGLAMMLLDVLSGFSELKICVAYEHKGRRLNEFPATLRELQECVPVYETLPGWNEELSDVRGYEELPLNARRYLERISELVGAPIAMVSVGPRRDQTIIVQTPFAG